MTPTRRDAVLGGLALAAPALRARAGEGGIAVIGAGAAGLSAAAALRRAGRSVTVLEARERIGGRAFTDRGLGPDLRFDAGAQYIHWAERNPWAGIARAAGVRIADEDGWARTLVIDGRPATDAERARRRKGFADLAGRAAAAGDVSMTQAAEPGGPDAVAAARALARMSLGEEPERVSARDEDRLWNGADLWVDGYGDLVARHFSDIPVRTGTVVEGIDWSGGPVRIATARGTLSAEAVVVTVPVGVLPSLRFTPGLPEAVEGALHGLGMGAYTKIALALDPARIDLRGVGDAVSVARARDTDLTLYFEAAPFGRSMLVANLGGDGARDLCRMGEAAALALARERLAAILGHAAPAAVTGGRLADWWTDPFARGSYSIARPGRADARTRLRAPIGGRVFLAGEALQEEGAMTVGGATLDGERAAGAVLRALAG